MLCAVLRERGIGVRGVEQIQSVLRKTRVEDGDHQILHVGQLQLLLHTYTLYINTAFKYIHPLGKCTDVVGIQRCSIVNEYIHVILYHDVHAYINSYIHCI